jgi:hypothetical protein
MTLLLRKEWPEKKTPAENAGVVLHGTTKFLSDEISASVRTLEIIHE